MAEGEEHQAGLLAVGPGHRAAQDEGLRREAFLGGALDVGGLGSVFQLLVVALAPADDVVLLLFRQSVEAVQIVQPVLHGGEAAAAHAVGSCAGDGGGQRRLVLGVFRAVLVAGQVVTAPVAEGIAALHQAQGRRQRGDQRAAALQQLAAVVAAQPAPQGMLGRGDIHGGAVQHRERAQAVDPAAEGVQQCRAETGHGGLPVGEAAQLVERAGQAVRRLEGEEQVACLRRYRGGEDARLGVTHGDSLGEAARGSVAPASPGLGAAGTLPARGKGYICA
ncbi:hypothetical protein D3C78_617480 [compost metagenome]